MCSAGDEQVDNAIDAHEARPSLKALHEGTPRPLGVTAMMLHLNLVLRVYASTVPGQKPYLHCFKLMG